VTAVLIGIDPHKGSHTAVELDRFQEMRNSRSGSSASTTYRV
jgi:hypothetical protein